MVLVVCLDNNNGVMFNSRRQSRDAEVYKRVARLAESCRLLVGEYSAPLFADFAATVTPDFLSVAEKGDFCFAENVDFTACRGKVEKLIVYRWNKVYPTDVFFPTELFENKSLVSAKDFKGNSHAVITEEIYV